MQTPPETHDDPANTNIFEIPEITKEVAKHGPGLLLALTSKTARRALHEVRSEVPFVVSPDFPRAHGDGGQVSQDARRVVRRDTVLSSLQLTATQHSLTSIVMPHVHLPTFTLRIARVIQRCPLLNKLDLQSCGIQDWRYIAPAVRRCPLLAHLNLSQNYFGSRNDVEQLIASLVLLPALSHLDMHECNLTPSVDIIIPVLPQLLALRHLDVSNNALHFLDLLNLFRSIDTFPALRSLVLNHSNVDSHLARNLGRRLQQCHTLRKLDLASNRLGREGFVNITKNGRTARLTHLNLAHNMIDAMNVEGVNLHFQATLRNSPALTHLVLRDNRLGNRCMQAIVAELPQCHSLVELDLDGCFISDVGVTDLAQAIPQCRSLSVLRLQDNLITQPAITQITNAWVAKHSSTEGLFLDAPDAE